MAFIVRTSKPDTLLNEIYRAIDEGRIDTWSYDSDGDLTHCATQWNKQAWLRPKIEDGVILFFIIGRKNIPITRQLYSIYHGRFVEMLINHLYMYCDSGEIVVTSQPMKYDKIK